ncbi:MAG TPA: CRTAC1 family protein [Bryobacteraceae bacterium]
MRPRRLVVLLPILLAAAGPVASTIRFEEVAASAGLKFFTDSCPTPNKNQPETMVSGAAVFDYDGDGYLDVYLVNGAAIPSLQKESPKYFNRLFRNNRNLTFTDVTAKAGVSGEGYGMGAAVGDYDNDGRPDLFLANVTKNQLFHNNGDGTFEDVTAKAGLTGGVFDGRKMWSVAAAWFDYNKDGLLDLFVSNYCKWEVNKDPVCMAGGRVRAYCHPNNYAPLPNSLYRNNGDGTFTDVSKETGIAASLGKGMGVAIADYDGDGFPDVFVANDNSPNFLFHNIGGKRFEEVALEAGVAYDEGGRAISGMGAEFRDINNDGRPDIWHTAIEHEMFPLFVNAGGGAFQNMTGRSGLAPHTYQMSGWSNAVGDLDNDGWKDLLVARGNVLDNVSEVSTRQYGEPNGVFRNLGNLKFENVTASAGADFQKPAPHRGAVLGDLDNDGRLDAVITVLNGEAKLFHNVSANANHWIAFKLTGSKSNRMAIGAQLRLTGDGGQTQYDEVETSSGYAASTDPRVHFGLGASKRVRELEIRWPSGIRQVLRDLEADRIVTIEEPQR